MKITTEKGLIILAFSTVYLVWGSTYLAIEYVIDFAPPLLISGVRFFTAGVILYLFTRFFQKEKATARQWLHNGLIGLLLIGIGMGGGAWAQQYVDSGYAALLIGSTPLVIVLMAALIHRRLPSQKAVIGVLIGFTGLYLLASQSEIMTGTNGAFSVFIIIFGVITWAFGTVIAPKLDLCSSKLLNASLQLTVAGSLLFISGIIAGEIQGFSPERVPLISWLCLLYLIVFGSILAFIAYNYLLEKVSAEKISTVAYVNPVIAVFLGWWFREEMLTGQTIVAAVVMLVGVYFINSSE